MRGMTERKPPDITFETWIDRQIRTARERGDFDDLPGAGKPLPRRDGEDGEMWWIRNHLQREGLPTDALLPTPLQLRREIERLPQTFGDLHSEQAVRDQVDELNVRIMAWLRAPHGPQIPVAPVNADEVVERWRAHRQQTTGNTSRQPPATTRKNTTPPPERGRWWRFTRSPRTSK